MSLTDSTDATLPTVTPHPLEHWIETLFDDDSFLSLDSRSPESHAWSRTPVTGIGQINDRSVACIGVPSGTAHPQQMVDKVLGLARQTGCPVILVTEEQAANEPPGNLHGWISSLAGLSQLSGVVPIISVGIGPCSPAQELVGTLADFRISIGANPSGTYSHVADELAGACEWVRDLLARLPQNNCEFAPYDDLYEPDADPALPELVPANPAEPYDVLPLLEALSDDDCLQVEGRGEAMISAFMRIGGRSLGVLASQPAHRNGLLGPSEARQAARFLRFCDAFNLPVLFLVDVPGDATKTSDTYAAYAQLAQATAEVTIPVVTVLLRQAYGLAASLFGSKALGADIVLAWPAASLAPAGLHRTVNAQLAEDATDHQRAQALERQLTRANDLQHQTSEGHLDQVIDPRDTSRILASWFTMLENKRKQNPSKKHGNLPL
jgi:acetyl-CoA carboxylase carboxyltransferase component